MKRILIAFLNLIIVLIVLCSYKTSQSTITTENLKNGNLNNENEVAENIEMVGVNITYEEQLGNSVLSEVQNAIQKLPPDVIRAFARDNWKIAVVSQIDLTNTEFEGESAPMTVGLTDYDTKTIQVSPFTNTPDNFVMIKTLHELCHFADLYYGNVAESTEWEEIYNNNLDYVEYEFNGLKVTERNKKDIQYATSDKWELFACAMKDYFNQPDYLKDNYSGIYEFMDNLVNKKE